MNGAVGVVVNVEAVIRDWSARHASSPYARLDFQRDVVPALKAACDAYLACHGDRECMQLRYDARMSLSVGRRTSPQETARIADECWRELQLTR